MTGFALDPYLAERRARVDAALERLLPPEDAAPAAVHQAMRHSVFAGGKRLRPILALAGAEAVGGDPARALPAACALELLHTYSLIHDDLPAMDDDDLRRGRPTCHKAFGEAVAILAGDALLTLAFRELAASAAALADPRPGLQAIVEIADAAGTDGMVGGQIVDLASEGVAVDPATLEYIHTRKTARLIRVSLRVGALLAGARAAELEALGQAGERLGLAFQIADDILDVEGTSAELGKTAGKDLQQGKATYPAVHGLDAARARARALVAEAAAGLVPLGPAAEPVRALGAYIVERRS